MHTFINSTIPDLLPYCENECENKQKRVAASICYICKRTNGTINLTKRKDDNVNGHELVSTINEN